MKHQQQEIDRHQPGLQQADRFAVQARNLGLEENKWIFYDVHVQGAFDFETARQIIEQCSHSDQAYYWPITLEVKALKNDDATPAGGVRRNGDGQVQLTVKGKFVARQ